MHLRYGKLEISDFYVCIDRDNSANQSYDSIYIVLTVVEKTNIKIVRTLMMKRVEENLDSSHHKNSKGVKFVAFNNSDINSSTISIRCCCGWELCFSIMDLVSDRFLIQKNVAFSSMTVSLRSADEESTGVIAFRFNYFPERSSFPTLIIDCAGSLYETSQMIHLSEDSTILSYIDEMLRHFSCLSYESDELRAAGRRLSSSLTYFRTTLFSDDVGGDGGSLLQSFRAFASVSEGSQATARMDTPVLSSLVLPQYKVATLAKSFLASLSADIIASPLVTMDLIEKMLTIFNSLGTRDNEASKSSPISSKNSVLKMRSGDEDEESSWSWVQFHTFCAVSGLWLLKQSELALHLLIEHGDGRREVRKASLDLIPEELDAVRMAFQCADAELMGSIQTMDLFYLLQDMGEEYSEEELVAAGSELDGDNLGLVFFEDFISWWCT